MIQRHKGWINYTKVPQPSWKCQYVSISVIEWALTSEGRQKNNSYGILKRYEELTTVRYGLSKVSPFPNETMTECRVCCMRLGKCLCR